MIGVVRPVSAVQRTTRHCIIPFTHCIQLALDSHIL
jgi:hypothetical protein